MLVLENITKAFGSEIVLSDISLSITGGMNYIIGASGSGKTTLLRILSAMDAKYDGEAYYQGKNLKTLSQKEKARLYATEIGFIAQGFHLIEELSVRENIRVPSYLKGGDCEERLKMLLKRLKLENIQDQKISNLSGGQKQRVAIARELMKDPQVLIADEPTAALDAKTAYEISKLLASIAKERTVIVVTHDTSLIQGKCTVFELDKGVLCECSRTDSVTQRRRDAANNSHLTIRAALQVAGVNFRRQTGKLLSLVIAIAIAVSCLAVNFSGMLSGSSDAAFEQLVDQQGNSVLNLTIVPSFMSAMNREQENPDVSQSVDQDISGLLEQYQDDSRVAGIIMDAALNDLVVKVDGKDYIIETTGQAPVFNKMLVGKIADNTKNEIVLPQVLVRKLGKTNEEMIGKELSFIGSVYNWESVEPVPMPVSFTATVSGIADTSYGVEIDGEIMKIEHEDSLFLSLAIVKDIYAQAEKEDTNYGFVIRPTTPENYLEIYDELMAKGIVPLGQAELIRDIVGLKSTAIVQTGVSYILITALAVLAALSVCFICSVMRKKEYAIYRLSGFTKSHLVLLTLMEYGGIFLLSSLICAIVTLILHVPMWLGIVTSFGVSLLCFGESCIFAVRIKPLTALKTGGR